MKKPREDDFKYYLKHQKELVKKYDGQVVVIKNLKVIGAYETEMEAIEETCKTEELGTFVVQKCEPGTDAYTATFHSRVTFG